MRSNLCIYTVIFMLFLVFGTGLGFNETDRQEKLVTRKTKTASSDQRDHYPAHLSVERVHHYLSQHDVRKKLRLEEKIREIELLLQDPTVSNRENYFRRLERYRQALDEINNESDNERYQRYAEIHQSFRELHDRDHN